MAAQDHRPGKARVVLLPRAMDLVDPGDHASLDREPVVRLLVEEHVGEHLVGELADEGGGAQRNARQGVNCLLCRAVAAYARIPSDRQYFHTPKL